MNWGKSIILAFVLFAIFIGVLVSVCIRQDISLVSKNYYQEELAYQEQIIRLTNTEQLIEKPSLQLTDGWLEIHFDGFGLLAKGELKLFRPSDTSLDKNFTLKSTSDGVQRFDLRQLPTGMYKARMQWSMRGKEYYLENIINL